MNEYQVLINEFILWFSGVLWCIITWIYRGRIKSFWLYSLFGYTIYSLVLPIIAIKYTGRMNTSQLYILTISYTAITGAYTYRLLRGKIDFKDTLIFPLMLIIILSVLIYWVMT